jgi:hypothetical protein
MRVTGSDVERALFEQSRDEMAVARVFDRLRGAAAARAAEALNQALEVDIFEVLVKGWTKVPTARTQLELDKLLQGPPPLVNLGQHSIASTSHVVLDSRVGESALPPLKLALEIVAEVESATLAVREGRIEVVALGEVSIVARLMYESVLLKEHETSVWGVMRDPFKRQTSVADRETTVDIRI